MKHQSISDDGEVTIEICNVAGIDHTSINLESGLTTLTGRNATNRTSFLLAMNEVLGGTMGSKRRGSSEKAFVEMELDGDTYTRTLSQRTGKIRRNGQQYCTDSSIVDLYVTLIKENKIRQLVETGTKMEIDNRLADLLMAPVDADKIATKIQQHQQRLEKIRKELADIEQAKEALPDLKKRRDELTDTQESLEEGIESTHNRLTEVNIDEDAAEEAQKLLAELQSAREERHDIQSTIERKQRALTNEQDEVVERRKELEAVEKELEQLSVPDEEEIEGIERRKRQLNRAATSLDGFVDACRALIGENSEITLPTDIGIDISHGGHPTSQLIPNEEEINCPACGTSHQRDEIENRIERLETIAAECDDEANQLESQREKLQSQRKERERLKQERERRENEIQRIEHRIEEKKHRIEELEVDLGKKQETIESLEEEIEKAEARRNDEFEQLHDKLAELQSEHAEVSAELNRVTDKINRQQSMLADEDELREKEDTLDEKIKQQRSRINDLEKGAQDAVTEHMEQLIDCLEYDQIEGVRLVRKPTDVPHELSDFELTVARRQQNGKIVEERDVTTLSESERSLLGLVVGIAGYITHTVDEDVPFLLLDSIEQFDGERINSLLDYLKTNLNIEYLITALLPSDARGLTTDRSEIPAKILG
jgi:DNA repair exonuclease SbcCD ATPase subunit